VSEQLNEKTISRYKWCLKTLVQETIAKSQNGQLRLRDDTIGAVFAYYDAYKKIMIGYMDEKDTLDEYKIAAAFCGAVLKALPLELIRGESIPIISINPYENRANELCAYLMGIQVLQDVWVDKSFDAGRPAQERLIYNHVIQAPVSRESAVTYADWFIELIKPDSTINYLDYDSPHFDIRRMFFISHLYFLIERFSYQYYRVEIAEPGAKTPDLCLNARLI
jgi:hypothetical protein